MNQETQNGPRKKNPQKIPPMRTEQTRKKNLKDDFEDLKQSIPSCRCQKLTKSTILNKGFSFFFVFQKKKEKRKKKE